MLSHKPVNTIEVSLIILVSDEMTRLCARAAIVVINQHRKSNIANISVKSNRAS
jgi:hypothetical protein